MAPKDGTGPVPLELVVMAATQPMGETFKNLTSQPPIATGELTEPMRMNADAQAEELAATDAKEVMAATAELLRSVGATVMEPVAI